MTETLLAIRELLVKLGYRVAGIATSKEEIIAKIEESKPDLILTDIRVNGAGEEIKTGEFIHSNYTTPIVYLTKSLGEKTIQRAKSTGPFGYIFKPSTRNRSMQLLKRLYSGIT